MTTPTTPLTREDFLLAWHTMRLHVDDGSSALKARVLALLDQRDRLQRDLETTKDSLVAAVESRDGLAKQLVKAKRECHDMAIKLGDDVAQYMESVAVQAAKSERDTARAESETLRAQVAMLRDTLKSTRLGHDCGACRVHAYAAEGRVGGAGYDPEKHHPLCLVHAALASTSDADAWLRGKLDEAKAEGAQEACDECDRQMPEHDAKVRAAALEEGAGFLDATQGDPRGWASGHGDGPAEALRRLATKGER
jgi:multidrug efflux pump subunit AcrA (membrane-fusion protein)